MDHERIALFDDSDIVRDALRTVLSFEEHTVVAEASSVEEAQRVIEDRSLDFRIAIVDGRMPDKGDGEKVAGMLREQRPETVIFALSTDDVTFGDENFSKQGGTEKLLQRIKALE